MTGVKETYSDVDDYIATFEPLMFEEVKAQIIQGKKDDEGGNVFGFALFVSLPVELIFRLMLISLSRPNSCLNCWF